MSPVWTGAPSDASVMVEAGLAVPRAAPAITATAPAPPRKPGYARSVPVSDNQRLELESVADVPSGPTWITILPVVARARVLERAAEIRAAIADFLATRRELMEHYRRGTRGRAARARRSRCGADPRGRQLS